MHRRIASALLPVVATALLVAAAPASAAPPPATMTLKLGGVNQDKVMILDRVIAKGTLKPATGGQRVEVSLLRSGNVLQRRAVSAGDGTYQAAFRIEKDGTYKVRAEHAESPDLGAASRTSNRFGVRYPVLRSGNRGPRVRLFNRLLQKKGYLGSDSSRYTAKTGRGVMAFRKVNGMRRTYSPAGSDIFRKLARNQGGYRLQHPGSGRHAEVSLRRQVMVLADGSRVRRIHHVSTGAPSTPTLRGHFNFYRREPGTNSKGMYYSFYYQGGYAIHGYKSVPTHPASHGCVRTPIPDQKSIYGWLQMGDSIHIY